MVRIIYIDNDKKWQDILRFSLPSYSITSSYTGRTGVNMVKKRSPDIVLLNNKLPDMRGVDVLEQINSMSLPPPVIILGSCDNPHDVVQTIQHGAADFLLKPFNLNELKRSIRVLVSCSKVQNTERDWRYDELDALVGDSGIIQKIKRDIISFALSDAAVLLIGETGTGKDIIARMIHTLSMRKNGPYQILPAGAIPFTLIESQLYGTEKGAFTGAVSHAGLFEKADKGTLFIDEIGEMSSSAQVKLLRILEDNEITRIGGKNRIHINVRIVSATNIDIRGALKRKHFRRDLYYRISALLIEIPPLRARKEDIPLLVHHFLNLEKYGSSVSSAALTKLMEYSWLGNIRELRNVLYRAMVLSKKGKIRAESVILENLY